MGEREWKPPPGYIEAMVAYERTGKLVGRRDVVYHLRYLGFLGGLREDDLSVRDAEMHARQGDHRDPVKSREDVLALLRSIREARGAKVAKDRTALNRSTEALREVDAAIAAFEKKRRGSPT